MAAGQPVVNYRPLHLRHVVDASQGTPGAVQILGRWFAPQDRRGVNGPGGWVSAEVEDRLLEEGRGKIRFSNTVGGDGVSHVDRFQVLGATAAAYAPGDEWLEIYEGPFPCGDVVACVTPGDAVLDGVGIELDCTDALGPLKAVRETTAGHWHHAPRDVIEHYTGAWVPVLAETFASESGWFTFYGPSNPGAPSQFVDGGVQLAIDSASDFNGLRPDYNVPAGQHWRCEVALSRFTFDTPAPQGTLGPSVDLSVNGITGSFGVSTYADGSVVLNTPAAGGRLKPLVGGSRSTLALERRGPWIFAYVDGRAIAVAAWEGITGSTYSFSVRISKGATAPARQNAAVRVESFLLRDHRPFLLRGTDKGDLRLPGALTPGGLVGEYYDDADINGDLSRVLSPLREPYARRLDPDINFATGTEWQPIGPAGGERFSVRWTGAIYLPLESFDQRVRIADLDDSCRVWIGRTRLGEQIIDRWTPAAGGTTAGPYLRGHLQSTQSGWYPIIIEFADQTGGQQIRLQINHAAPHPDPAAWFTVPAAQLSPLGIYTDHVRHESHHDQIQKIASTFGYQWRCQPRQLESGHFPGELVPRIRVGRDTAHVLHERDATDVGVKLAAREVAHTLIVDAAGTADPASGNQLTREAIDYNAISRHLIVHQGMENLADITDPALLEQRANSLLALFASAWEETSVRPPGGGALTDAWPLAGVLALFDWQPGDGIRLDLPTVGVRDLSPRQLLGVTRTLNPNGAGVPVVAFRQRPRSFSDTVRGILKTALQPRRTYQGGLTVINGSQGGAGGVDVFTRAMCPGGPDAIVGAHLNVYKSDSSAWLINVNGVSTGVQVTTGGRYDVTAYARRAGGGDPRCYANLTGGTGVVEYQLELTARI